MDSFYEVSYSLNEKLRAFVTNMIDDDRMDCRDPFDLVAEQEEDAGCPLVHL